MAVVEELIAKLGFRLDNLGDAKKFEQVLDRLERRGRSSSSAIERGAAANTRALRRQAEYAERHAAVIERANRKAEASSGGWASAAGGAAARMAGRLGGPLAAGYGVKKTMDAAISIEKSLAEVRKFYDLGDADLAKMKAEIFDMVAELGKAPEAIAEIYARAGQQGVPRDQVRDYARDVAKIAVAWDMTEQAAANGLGTIKSSLGLTQPELVKLAGTINTLADGMEGPVAESDLLEYLSRVAGTAKALGGSAKSALAVGAALRSSGDQPEIAATTFNSIFTKLASADRGSKNQIAGYKELGFNPDKLAKDMRKNADVAFRAFFGRIKEMQGQGKNVIGPIAQIFGTEYSDNILKFVNAIELYDKAMGMVRDDAASVEQLNRNYKIFSSTTDANIKKMWANLTVVGDTLGSDFLPGFNSALDKLNEFLIGIRQFRAEYAGAIEDIKSKGADWGTAIFGSGKEKAEATKRINDRFADDVVSGGGVINGGLAWALPDDQRAAAENRLADRNAAAASVGSALGAGATPIGTLRGRRANSRVGDAWSAIGGGKVVADVSSFTDPASQAAKMAMDIERTYTAKFTADISDFEAKVKRMKTLAAEVPSLSSGSFTGATPARVADAGAAP